MTQDEMWWILKQYNGRCKTASCFKKSQLDKYKNVKLMKWMSEKVVYGVIIYQGETLFELDEDGYYILHITLLCYKILYINY